MKKISIIIPSFNQGRFLSKTLSSIISQNDPNVEIIVIDGGSSDSTIEVIKHFENEIYYWVSEPDKGQADALNKGLLKARGDIIGWINSDDIYLPNALKKIRRQFDLYPDVDVVHGNRVTLDEDDFISGWSFSSIFQPEKYGYNICSETAFWKKLAADGMHFDAGLHFAMDLDWFSRLYKEGRRFKKIDSYIGGFRCYKTNKSSTIQHIGTAEAAKVWPELFGNSNWKKKQPEKWFMHKLAFIFHPRKIALPYLYRRFYVGRRGI